MPNLEKNAKIREKRKQTLLRRKTKEAKTFELKLDKSKISKTKLAILNRLFLEAKWYTNYIIANGILNFKPHADYKVKTVHVKVCNTFQEREIQALSSQMKQALIKRLQDNV
ncbi:MAG: transposase, partial [Nitrososphaeria archaeon]